MKNEPILSIKHLYCQVGRRYLLHDINWEVKPGENWVVFGANGSGKTTLLSIIAGFRSQTKGEISVLGEPFARERLLLQRQRIGYVSGSFLDDRYSREMVLDIVLSGVTGTLSPNGLVEDEAVKRAKALLKQLEVSTKTYASFDTLSKGEREKVLLARALVSQPKLLLLDEPATGLDLAARERLLEMIDTMAWAQKQTLIHVTHHVEEISPAFTHALLLKNGRIFAQGTIDEIVTAESLSKFLHYPLALHWHQGRLFAQRREDSE